MTHTTPTQRYERGLSRLEAVDGPAGLAVVETLARAFPDFATYIVEFPFGDIYARDGLDLREREIATVAALCALGNGNRNCACTCTQHCTSAASPRRLSKS